MIGNDGRGNRKWDRVLQSPSDRQHRKRGTGPSETMNITEDKHLVSCSEAGRGRNIALGEVKASKDRDLLSVLMWWWKKLSEMLTLEHYVPKTNQECQTAQWGLRGKWGWAWCRLGDLQASWV
jgi:hypothetical protein